MGCNISFKDQCLVRRCSETISGNGEMIKAWTTIKTIKCFLNDYNGGERYIDDRKEMYSDAFLLCNLNTDITSKDRIQCTTNGREYEVVFVSSPTNSVRTLFLKVLLKYI